MEALDNIIRFKENFQQIIFISKSTKFCLALLRTFYFFILFLEENYTVVNPPIRIKLGDVAYEKLLDKYLF